MTAGPSPHQAGSAGDTAGNGTHDTSTWGGLIGSAVLCAGSVIFLVGGIELGLGSPFRLGTGAFPFATGLILLVLSLAIGLQEWRAGDVVEMPDWISFLAISGALATFAATAERFGLAPAAFLTIVIASLPDRSLPFAGKVALGIGVSLACWGLFIKLLNLPFKAFVGII